MGARTARSRWFNYFEHAESFLPCWYPLLLVLTWHGIQRGHFKDLASLPIQRERDSLEALCHEQAVPDDEEPLLQSAGSSTDKPPERTGAGGQLIAATYTLADRSVRDSSALMVCLVRPLRQWHLSLVCQLRSPEGCAEHVIGAACGSWYSIMHKVWAVLQDEPSLRTMGFATERAEFDAARLDSSHSC
eukprot:219585-Amphidinium_carterae.1